MNNDHESVIDALFTYLQGAVGLSFPTMSRRWEHWGQVSEQPALFLVSDGSEDDYGGGIFARTTLKADICIYSRAGDNPDVSPDTALNNLIKIVRDAFAPDSVMGTFTIGGICQWCRVEGTTDHNPGYLDGQAEALIPVRILLP